MKRYIKVLVYLLIIIGVAIGSHVWTMQHLEIETDGGGDSAFVKCAGVEWFMGINGYEIG